MVGEEARGRSRGRVINSSVISRGGLYRVKTMDSDRRQGVGDYLTSLEEEDLFPPKFLGEYGCYDRIA